MDTEAFELLRQQKSTVLVSSSMLPMFVLRFQELYQIINYQYARIIKCKSEKLSLEPPHLNQSRSLTFRILLFHQSLILLFIILVKAIVTSLKSLNQPDLRQCLLKKEEQKKSKKCVSFVELVSFCLIGCFFLGTQTYFHV